MTTCIKTKYKISDDQTNIVKYRIAVNITEDKEIRLLWSSESFEGKYNIGFGIPMEFPSKKKLVKSVHKQEIGLLWSS